MNPLQVSRLRNPFLNEYKNLTMSEIVLNVEICTNAFTNSFSKKTIPDLAAKKCQATKYMT